MHGSSSAGKSNTTSRLSLPSNNGTANVYKPSTSKRLFNLISGVSSKNQQNQQQTERIQNFQANQQRRLSDFHRPAKVRLFFIHIPYYLGKERHIKAQIFKVCPTVFLIHNFGMISFFDKNG